MALAGEVYQPHAATKGRHPWKVTLSYDGTSFLGWQVQPALRTVQGTLAEAILRVTGETVLPQGSGRTDAGVHALGQVASFSLVCAIPATNLHRALNRVLPASVRVLAVESVAPEFHARHSALWKTYEYRIFCGALCSPMLAPYVWSCDLRLELEALQAAARKVVGTHDFTSFAAVDPDRAARLAHGDADAVRTITCSCWSEREALLVYRVTGTGFLHHMVRNLVGTFVEVGAGRRSPDSLPAVLEARRRTAAGPTAPARGLFLVEVGY
jgi:tRNA pseudouridine38-40 synthase